MATFQFLSCALKAFTQAAVAPEYRDFDKQFDELELLEAPGPFRVEEYDTRMWRTKEHPDHEHDCCREECGNPWRTGGAIGVVLVDGDGRIWRDAGIVVRMRMGFLDV